jgi:alanine dehydrogenase
MRVRAIKEMKDKGHRVALTPAGTTALQQVGHTVLVQAGAGLGVGFTDAQYAAAGATMVSSASLPHQSYPA